MDSCDTMSYLYAFMTTYCKIVVRNSCRFRTLLDPILAILKFNYGNSLSCSLAFYQLHRVQNRKQYSEYCIQNFL